MSVYIVMPHRLSLLSASLLTCSVIGATLAHADPLTSPTFTGPLAPNANPMSFDAGPLGTVFVTGQFSALGLTQSHAVPGSGNSDSLVDLSNAQFEIQNTSGPLQFFIQGGAYSLPALGTPYLRSDKATTDNFGLLSVGYAKLVLTPEISIQAGALPTLIGAEYTFSYQNMNIERGLLWNQEPAVSKGMQINYSKGPLNAAVSFNDGFDSDRYNWISGSISYAFTDSSTLAFAAGGNFSHTFDTKFVAPVAQGNSSIYNLIYTYTDGPITINPYLQYTNVGRNPGVGIDTSAQTLGGAILAKYSITPEFSIAARGEYIKAFGGSCHDESDCSPTNLLYGPDSSALSLTITPTYQSGIFFARGELSYTHIGNPTPGFAFGEDQNSPDQVRALLETGILF